MHKSIRSKNKKPSVIKLQRVFSTPGGTPTYHTKNATTLTIDRALSPFL